MSDLASVRGPARPLAQALLDFDASNNTEDLLATLRAVYQTISEYAGVKSLSTLISAARIAAGMVSDSMVSVKGKKLVHLLIAYAEADDGYSMVRLRKRVPDD